MKAPNPFSPIPLTNRSRPIVLSRDRRAQDIEDHLAPNLTGDRIARHELQRATVIRALAFIFIVLILRLGYLQIARGDIYRSASERNRIRLEVIRAPRGVIYDRHRQPLLQNVPSFTLYAIPADLPKTNQEREEIASSLASTLSTLDREMTRESLVTSPKGSIQPLVLSEYVSYDNALRLSSVIARLPGISLEAAGTRSYTDGASLAHLIGYLGKPRPEELTADTNLSTLAEIGRMGIEFQYDTLLRGNDGVREVERDHLNKELSVIASKQPTPGKNVVLSVDQGLQRVLHTALREAVNRLDVPGGAAVALDPRTGEVLALVSEPSFDPNLFTGQGEQADFEALFKDPRHPLYFRALSGSYPSGSTIKPFIAAAALSEGLITERTTVESSGGLRVGPNFFPDWKPGGHGTTDVRQALAESVNTFFYMIGGGFEDFEGLGVDRIVKYLSRFGFGESLGVDLPGESSGFLPSSTWRNRPGATRWFLGDTYHLAIGQGYLGVTPLQVASATAAIANGGTLLKPYVTREILNADGSLERTVNPVILRTTVGDNLLTAVRAGMRQAVVSGSAQALAGLPVPVAAKTGTAQIGSGHRTHAWLTSFAPYDRPEIVVTVLVEEGGEGHAAALPVAKRALEWYFRPRP